MDIGQRLVRMWLLSDGVREKKNGRGGESRKGSLVVVEKWSEGRLGSFLMDMMSETEDVIDNALRPRELKGTNRLIGSLRINWMRVRLFLGWSLEQAWRVTRGVAGSRRAIWDHQARTLTCNRSGSAYDSVARTDLPNYMYALLSGE